MNGIHISSELVLMKSLAQCASFDEVFSSVCLLPNWERKQLTTLCKLEHSQGQNCEVTRSIRIFNDFAWKIYVYEKEIPHSNVVLKNFETTLPAMPSSLQALINTLDTALICCENCEQQFLTLLEERDGSLELSLLTSTRCCLYQLRMVHIMAPCMPPTVKSLPMQPQSVLAVLATDATLELLRPNKKKTHSAKRLNTGSYIGTTTQIIIWSDTDTTIKRPKTLGH